MLRKIIRPILRNSAGRVGYVFTLPLGNHDAWRRLYIYLFASEITMLFNLYSVNLKNPQNEIKAINFRIQYSWQSRTTFLFHFS